MTIVRILYGECIPFSFKKAISSFTNTMQSDFDELCIHTLEGFRCLDVMPVFTALSSSNSHWPCNILWLSQRVASVFPRLYPAPFHV